MSESLEKKQKRLFAQGLEDTAKTTIDAISNAKKQGKDPASVERIADQAFENFNERKEFVLSQGESEAAKRITTKYESKIKQIYKEVTGHPYQPLKKPNKKIPIAYLLIGVSIGYFLNNATITGAITGQSITQNYHFIIPLILFLFGIYLLNDKK